MSPVKCFSNYICQIFYTLKTDIISLLGNIFIKRLSYYYSSKRAKKPLTLRFWERSYLQLQLISFKLAGPFVIQSYSENCKVYFFYANLSQNSKHLT